jgi:antitoxin HicB
MKRYSIEIFWSEEDEAFIAVAPDLPGCSAGGVTEMEALNQLQIAMRLWLEAAQSMGRDIPEPSEGPRRAVAG